MDDPRCWNDLATRVHELETENARLRNAAKQALNFIANTESELGITLDSGEALRAALAAGPAEIEPPR